MKLHKINYIHKLKTGFVDFLSKSYRIK